MAQNPAYIFGLLRNTDPFVFEEILLLSFKQLGYRVQHHYRYTGDGGMDGLVYDNSGKKYLLPAKRYKDAINPRHVAEFLSLGEAEQVFGEFLSTPSALEKKLI